VCGPNLQDHHKGPGRDEEGANDNFQGYRFVQEDKCQHDGNDETEFIYRNYLGCIAQLESLKVKEP
jgi:hypothetical protein